MSRGKSTVFHEWLLFMLMLLTELDVFEKKSSLECRENNDSFIDDPEKPLLDEGCSSVDLSAT